MRRSGGAVTAVANEFVYDVAFSFLAEDESSATQINDRLQDRYKTFLYSQRQKELAGTDGELTFNTVFSKEARTVAILYRPGWGETPWTRIEETAIRNRAHDHGYDFATFIAMTDPVSAPRWLPRNRILYGLKRFGIPGAAAALDARIQDQGGLGAEESIHDRAARLKRFQQFALEKDKFQRSEAGVRGADQAYNRLLEDIAKQADDFRSTINLQISVHGDYTLVRGGIVVLVLHWNRLYANSLDKAVLHVDFFKGVPRLPGLMIFDDPPPVERAQFKFQLTELDRAAWVDKYNLEHNEEDMAEFVLKKFMDHEEQEQRKKAAR
jgi:hypothetical protein